MSCLERKDSILLYAAGALDADEREELRGHLATGCPQCAGTLAEAHALLAQLPLALDRQKPPPNAKQRLMAKIAAAPSTGKMSIAPARRNWDRIILPSSLAALLAVAVVLTAIYKFHAPPAPLAPLKPDMSALTIMALNQAVHDRDMQLADRERKLSELQQKVAGMETMKFAELTGPAQPEALGRVFIDTKNGQWYFFTSGMKPAEPGKTYELWLIADDKKIPAGTFEVGENGSAQLLGKVPALPANSTVTLAVTDEPGHGGATPQGSAQISGIVRN